MSLKPGKKVVIAVRVPPSPSQVQCGAIVLDWGLCTFDLEVRRGRLCLGVPNEFTDSGNSESMVTDQR